jgi:hypothetical protein
MRVARIIEIIVGLLFLLAAALKAADMQSFMVQILYYQVLDSVRAAQVAAVGSVLVEAVLGVLLLAGVRFRGGTYAATLLVLAGFTGLVGWSWIFHDLKECGCFGKYMPMGPLETSLKNVAMAAALAVAWRMGARKQDTESQPGMRQIALSGAAGVLCVLVPFFTLDNEAFLSPAIVNAERPFEGLELVAADGTSADLNTGEQLVVMLSATCPDCMNAVAPLNEFILMGDTPAVTGLMLGDEADRQLFTDTTLPLFPVHLVDPVLFVKTTGPEPPRFYLLRDGVPVRHLDDLHITLNALLDFAETDAVPEP